jgi:hypothetical protein
VTQEPLPFRRRYSRKAEEFLSLGLGSIWRDGVWAVGSSRHRGCEATSKLTIAATAGIMPYLRRALKKLDKLLSVTPPWQ